MGKSKQVTLAKSLIAAVETVTKDWAKQRKAEERHASAAANRRDRMMRRRPITIKEAAYEIMQKAYTDASDNGLYPANARQVMYAARAHILQRTRKTQLDDAYFTQTILPQYLADYFDKTANWQIDWDARGHGREPHTGRVVDLGTAAVRKYLTGINQSHFVRPELSEAKMVTHGPHECFGAILFVEKEGFDALFEAVKLGNRHDLFIMSTKGMSNVASRRLIDELYGKYRVPVFCLHDFDISGFGISGTLGRDNEIRYIFQNDVKIVDIGLRLADVDEFNIRGRSEPAVGVKGNTRFNLKRNGATDDEIEFLLDQRVELNALSSGQLIGLIERRLAEHRVTKIVPTSDRLADTYRQLMKSAAVETAMAEFVKDFESGDDISIPEDLEQRVRKYLKDNPDKRWDSAVKALTDG
jgi:hypothetical protein